MVAYAVDGLVMAGLLVGAMEMDTVCAVDVPAAFEAVKETDVLPLAVGIPLTMPVDVANDNPAGKAPPVIA